MTGTSLSKEHGKGRATGARVRAWLGATVVAALAFGAVTVEPAHAAGSISLTTLGSAYTQDFDTLSATAGSTTNNLTISGWELTESGGGARDNEQYAVDTGESITGDTYSYGAAATTDRAFGTLRSGTLVPVIGATFTNATGSTITSLDVAYTGEQWRLGTEGRTDKLAFEISTDAASLTTGTWTSVTALDFTTPDTATVGAKNGNAAATRTARSATVNGLSIAAGETFWIRWADTDATGADDGLAVDDFSLTPHGAPPPAGLSVDDVSLTEGASGTTSFVFTVSIAAPAPTGGVTFDIATQDGTAASPSDFTATSLTGQTIPAGSSTTTFSVPVNGDTTAEPNETFFVNVTNVTGTTVVDGQGQGTIVNDDVDVCASSYTPIHDIQGAGPTAAITGAVTTKGVVVGDYEYPGSGSTSAFLRGFYLQDATGDADPATSEGIFVFNGNNNSVAVGDVVRVTGTASEFQDQTQLSSVTSIVPCGTGTVSPTDVSLPLASAGALEAYEGMLVRMPQTLSVTEHFQLGRFGQVVLSSGGRLAQPTSVVAPGAPALALQALNALNRIILDDASQAQNPDPILFGRGGGPLSASNTLRGGDTATGITGVLTYTWAGNAASGNAFRVRPVNALGGSVVFMPTNPRPAGPPVVGGTTRVASLNLLNFFNTFDGLPDTVDNCTLGVGGAPTDCRGADTAAEYARQWPKTVAAIVALDPHVLAVNEIENDGYGATSALQELVDKLNAATAPGTWAFVDVDARTSQPNALGTDAIKVGLLYKPGSVTPVGQTAALNTTAFVNGGDASARNRPALAQAFQVNATSARFVVVANHLKSKGSACDAPDAGDGQGNCNVVRTNAANALAGWLATNPTGTGDPDVLIVGDLNSYAKEDPVTALTNAGYTNLVESLLGAAAYSYVFDGQWGYLDHALASPSLVAQVSGVGDYHINADEPSALDYNTDFKTPNLQTTLYAPDQYRVSDHDPVLVGLLPDGPTTLAVTGTFYDSDGNGTTALTARLTGGCGISGRTVDFYVDLNGDGDYDDTGEQVGSDVTDAGGVASYDWAGPYGIWEVRAVFEPVAGCLGSSDEAAVAIVQPGDAANGGGWYQAFTTGSPRVNFGFTVRRQADGSYRGQLLWHNNEKWRIKGTLTSFGKTSPCTYAGTTGLRCGSAQGSGTLYHWNTTTLEWDPVQTVTYVISFVDGGSRKGGKKPDHFGINITNYSAASLPESAPQQLKGGNVLIP